MATHQESIISHYSFLKTLNKSLRTSLETIFRLISSACWSKNNFGEIHISFGLDWVCVSLCTIILSWPKWRETWWRKVYCLRKQWDSKTWTPNLQIWGSKCWPPGYHEQHLCLISKKLHCAKHIHFSISKNSLPPPPPNTHTHTLTHFLKGQNRNLSSPDSVVLCSLTRSTNKEQH